MEPETRTHLSLAPFHTALLSQKYPSPSHFTQVNCLSPLCRPLTRENSWLIWLQEKFHILDSNKDSKAKILVVSQVLQQPWPPGKLLPWFHDYDTHSTPSTRYFPKLLYFSCTRKLIRAFKKCATRHCGNISQGAEEEAGDKKLTFLLDVEHDKVTKTQCFWAKESFLSLLVWFEELSSKTASIVIVSPRIS